VKQVSLDPSNGRVDLLTLDRPIVPRNGVLVSTRYSIISSGTERSKVDLATKPLWEKARERPEQVAKVLDSIRTEGLVATAQKVHERLAAPQPLGYSLAGTVLEVGAACPEFSKGMRVACGGTSACHAEVVAVPLNLVVPVPEGVSLADASFATIGSIPLHAIRTGEVAIGDRVLILGLGLIGQLAARLCTSAGAHVFGVDPRTDRTLLALASGAERAETGLDQSTAQQVLDWSRGRGADVILVTAGGGDSAPLVLAGAAARDRARVVVVGAIPLEIPREPFYEKELNVVVSRSYGPGRYDPMFEEKGFEYPTGFVPWTERRNMEEVLNLLGSGRLSLAGLNESLVPFDRAPEAYERLSASGSPIAIVLDYNPEQVEATPVSRPSTCQSVGRSEPRSFSPRPLKISFLGMGGFASSYLLPSVKSVTGIELEHVVTSTQLKAESVAQRARFRASGTDPDAVFRSPQTEVVFIATRHDSHARYVEAALTAGKAVFVEKPLALTELELQRATAALDATAGRLMVGFNRRFAPATYWTLQTLGTNRAGLRLLYRINAGPLPQDHWLLDPEIGGGRLLGEGCHFLDFARFIAGSTATEVEARTLDRDAHPSGPQSFHIAMSFANGASAAIEYLSSGDPSLPKERIEIHRSGTSIVIDDFRSALAHRAGRRHTRRWTRDKGHRAEVREFLEAVRSGAPTPIREEESIETMRLTFAALRSLREGRPVPVSEARP